MPYSSYSNTAPLSEESIPFDDPRARTNMNTIHLRREPSTMHAETSQQLPPPSYLHSLEEEGLGESGPAPTSPSSGRHPQSPKGMRDSYVPSTLAEPAFSSSGSGSSSMPNNQPLLLSLSPAAVAPVAQRSPPLRSHNSISSRSSDIVSPCAAPVSSHTSSAATSHDNLPVHNAELVASISSGEDSPEDSDDGYNDLPTAGQKPSSSGKTPKYPPPLSMAPHASHCSFYSDKRPLILSHVIDINKPVPVSLLQSMGVKNSHKGEFTDGPYSVRVNAFFRSHKKVDIRLGIRGLSEPSGDKHERRKSSSGSKQQTKDRINVFACSKAARVTVEVAERFPQDQPFSIRVLSKKSGGVEVILPRDFHGPIRIACPNGSIKLSADIIRHMTLINGTDLKCPLYFLGPLPPLSSNWADGLLPASDAKVMAKAGTRAIIHIANLGSLDSASLECAAKGNIEVRFGTEVVAVKKNIWRTMVGMKQAQPRPSGIDGKGGSTTKVVPRVTTTRGEPIDY